MLVAVTTNKNEYFETQMLSGPWKVSLKMPSVFEFSGSSYTTARVTFENVAVSKKEQKRKKRPRLVNPYVETENLKGKENSSLRKKQNL